MLVLSKGTEIKQKYVVHGEIGAGGYASVWRASDKDLGRDVALKRLLKTNFVADAANAEEILSEAKRHCQLVHHNIVQVYDVVEQDGEHLIVMEFIDGPSLWADLRKRAKDGTMLPLETAMQTLREVLSGIAYAHEKNVIHRDLSPANILLTSTGVAKLGDFGIARVLNAVEQIAPGVSASVHAGTGTRDYMSPEQARGESVDFTSDLFMIGIVGYLLLTLRHPFAHPSGLFQIHDLLRDHNYSPETPRAPASLGPAEQRLFREYSAVVMRLLHREKAARFPSARAAIEALDAVSPTLDCPKCGERVPDHFKFCGFCASPLLGLSAPAETPQPAQVPRNAQELTEEGFRFAERREWTSAIRCYEDALRQDPNAHKAYVNLGYAFNVQGRHADAKDILTRAMAIDYAPEHEGSVRHELAFAKAHLKDYDGAIEDANRVLELRPYAMRSLFLRAKINLWRGAVEEALADARAVLKRDPGHSGALRIVDQLGEQP